MTAKTLTALLLSNVFLLVSARVHAIDFGQVDTFQDDTTMDWQEGASSPNPPANVPTGGPAGVGDKFLQNVSSGGFGAGAKMIMFNDAQWIGNYNAAGVDRITAHMANFGSGTLYMRVGLRGGAQSTVYSSSAAAELPPDGNWYSVTFDLTTSSLTNLGGSDTLAQVLDSVSEVRVLSSIGGPSFTGDPVQGTLGVDNILGQDIARFILRLTNVAKVSGVPRISFTTVAGRPHRVEQRSSLSQGDWAPLTNATNITGTGGVVQVDDTEPGAGSQPARFYRVVLLPPP